MCGERFTHVQSRIFNILWPSLVTSLRIHQVLIVRDHIVPSMWLGTYTGSLTTTPGDACDQLMVPWTRIRTISDRAFGVASTRVWNKLPSLVVCAPSLAVFKKNLKTQLIQQSYSHWRQRVLMVLTYSCCTVFLKLRLTPPFIWTFFNNSNNNNGMCVCIDMQPVARQYSGAWWRESWSSYNWHKRYQCRCCQPWTHCALAHDVHWTGSLSLSVCLSVCRHGLYVSK